MPALESTGPGDTQPATTIRSAPQPRRAVLAAALGGLATATAAALGRPTPAEAAAGSALIVGSSTNNAGTSNTILTTTSSVVAFELMQKGPGTALMGYVTPTSGPTRGVYGRTDSPNGFGVQARNAGVAGTGAALQAIGVNNIGLDANTANGNVPAIRATNNGTFGTAIYATSANVGVWGSSTGGGTGVAGEGDSNGIYGASPNGYGVSGVSPGGVGAWGSSTSGTGVYGDSSSFIGVRGSSTSNYGVYGTSGSSYAGYFDGSLYATSASAAVKAFRIDHPLEPAGKVLMHSCVESNERKLVYDGVVTTDAAGAATVELPTWFGALNRDIRYQLTPLADARAWVQRKVTNNRFSVATSEPGVEVCWQVTGIRQDAFAAAHPLVVESAKTGREKGRYLNPLEHGKPASAGVNYELHLPVPPPVATQRP